MHRKYRKTLTKLFVFNLLIPLLIFAAVSITIGVLNYNRAFEAEQRRLVLVAESAADEIDTFLREYMQLLRSVSRMDPVVEVLPLIDDLTEERYFSDELEIPQTILQSLAGESGVDVLYVGGEDTAGLFADQWVTLPPDYDARTRPWYETPAQTREAHVTDPYETADVDVDELVISIGHPIERDGELLGVTALDTGFGIIDEIASRVRAEQGMFLSLFSTREMTMIWSEETEHWGIPLTAVATSLGYDDNEIPELIENLRANERFYFEGASTQTDGVAMLQTARVPSVPEWGVFMIADRQVVDQQIFADVVQPLIAAGLVFIAILGSGFAISAITIMKPLNFVSNSLEDLAEGAGDLTVSVSVNTRDDIRRLADNFNLFVDRMKDMVTGAKGAANDQTMVFNELTSSITETNAAMHEIVTNIESINAR